MVTCGVIRSYNLTDGFLGHDDAKSWVSKWYPIMVRALADRHQFPAFDPDFLVTEVGKDLDRSVFLVPTTRNTVVIWLRGLVRKHLETVGRSVSFDALTSVGVHSAKTIMLSWSCQLGL